MKKGPFVFLDRKFLTNYFTCTDGLLGIENLIIEYCELGSLFNLLAELTVSKTAIEYMPIKVYIRCCVLYTVEEYFRPTYLKRDGKYLISEGHLQALAFQIADGMTFLVNNNVCIPILESIL